METFTSLTKNNNEDRVCRLISPERFYESFARQNERMDESRLVVGDAFPVSFNRIPYVDGRDAGILLWTGWLAYLSTRDYPGKEGRP